MSGTHPLQWRALPVILTALLSGSVARGGHEMPVYPSYYPHEISIESMSPDRAAVMLKLSRIQAYIGPLTVPVVEAGSDIRAIESLGSFVVVRVNPDSLLTKDDARACMAVHTVLRDVANRPGFVFHPYPVTPFHGDYLFHADLAELAKSRILAEPIASAARMRVKAEGSLASLVRPDWVVHDGGWDVTLEAISAVDLMASASTSIDGWVGPPWLKTGWFQADQILSGAIDDPQTRRRVDLLRAQLESNGEHDVVSGVNLQRELVTTLSEGCRKVIAGYTVKQEYFSAEFTEGIENIGFDSIAGLNSPMFIRTVKLKDFPWNGWLALGTSARGEGAWNPIAGFTDPFGRLLWSAIGDPALLPAPYDSRWMLNRISDVQANAP
jgi:hypothetical protein